MTNYPAVRAFNRVFAPIARGIVQQACVDAQFDGGEWSGAIHANLFREAELHIAYRVGYRFGLTARQLLAQVEAAIYHEHQMFMEHLEREQPLHTSTGWFGVCNVWHKDDRPWVACATTCNYIIFHNGTACHSTPTFAEAVAYAEARAGNGLDCATA
jgi:hypothetical protein